MTNPAASERRQVEIRTYLETLILALADRDDAADKDDGDVLADILLDKRGTMPIDYARAKAKSPALKAALTRARKQVGSAHYPAVLAACRAAVKEWELWGAWPDNWSNWQRALDDAGRQGGILRPVPRLETL